MNYNEIGKTGMRVSNLSFGASSLGGVFHDIREAEGIKAVILQTHSGADGMQPKDGFQLGNGKIIIQFAIAIFHNQATGVTHNIIVAVGVEIFANRGNQTVDEDIFIIAAHGNFTVFHD